MFLVRKIDTCNTGHFASLSCCAPARENAQGYWFIR